jgi:hypothetical protein
VEAKLISGIDDHFRYSVIGKVVPRASARAVCTAFMAAMAEYEVPEEVLIDTVGSGRLARPRCCLSRSAGAPGPASSQFPKADRHFRSSKPGHSAKIVKRPG